MVEHPLSHLFYTDGTNYQWNITTNDNEIEITNNELTDAGIDLEESICDDNELKFGSFVASTFSFDVRNVMGSLYNKTITVQCSLDHHDENKFPVGVYVVKSDKPSADRKSRHIEAYDMLETIINADVSEWYDETLPNDDSTISMRDFRNSFFSHFNVQQVNTTLVNDNFIITKTIKLVDNEGKRAVLSGSEVLKNILEANGCFGRINRTGQFEYIYLSQGIMGLYPNMPDDEQKYPSETLYPRSADSIPLLNSQYTGACDSEDYFCKSIGEVEIRNKDGSTLIWEGTRGENKYCIENNFIFYGRTSADLRTAARNILNKITNIVYKPFSVTAVGNLALEPGDGIRINGKYGLIESYILKRSFSGSQRLEDKYSSTGVEEYQVDATGTNTRDVEQLNGIRRELIVSAEQLTSRIVDETNNRESAIEQLEDNVGILIKDGKLYTKLDLNTNGLSFTSDGVVVMNTSNFKINQFGDVTIKGSLSAGSSINGSTITGGSLSIPADDGSGAVEIRDGIFQYYRENVASIRGAHIMLTQWGMVFSAMDNSTHSASTQLLIQRVPTTERDWEISFSGGTNIRKDGISTPSLSVNGNSVLTAGSSIDASKVSGDMAINNLRVTTAAIIDGPLQAGSILVGSGHNEVLTTASSISGSKVTGTVSKASTADGLSGTLDSKSGLSASVTTEDLIFIGSTWRATSKRYADNHYQAISSSDERIKEDISDIDEKYLNALDNIKVKNFRFKKENGKFDRLEHVGVIAQEVLQVLDDCGINTEDQNIVEYREPYANEERLVDDGKVYCINYQQLTTLLIPAYQNLKKEYEQLQQEVRALTHLVNELIKSK